MSLFKSKTAKFFVGFVALAMVVTFVAAPSDAKAQTTSAELQAQINALLAQIAALQGGATVTTSMSAFTRDLTAGSTGADVMQLQKWLNANGYTVAASGAGSVGMETSYFGPATRAAVAKFQSAMGISPAVGYFGPMTRASLNAKLGAVVNPPVGGNFPAGCTSSSGFSSTTGMSCSPVTTLPAGCTSTTGFSPTTGMACSGSSSTPGAGLSGNAGSIEDADFIASLNNEEVGENSDDVEVAGLEVEADDGSDIEIRAIRLDFDKSTGATSDFEDYASEVSIWVDGVEYARVDADDFNDDNAFDKTISLDAGAIIRAGEVGDVVVAVSGINNLDSSDAGDTWTVIFTSVRFEDGDGAVTSETATGDIGTETRSFTFQTFATAADTVFKITEPNDPVNNSHTIGVDANDDTDDEPILVFNVEIEGDADVTVDRLPVGVLVAGATNVDDVISALTLLMDGNEVGSASISDCMEDANCAAVGTYESFIFDDMDLTLEGGEEYEFTVTADFYPTTGSGDLDDGDTIAASTSEALLESSNSVGAFSDIEDESGEDLAVGDIEGSASSDTNAIYANGIQVTFQNSSRTNSTVEGTDNDYTELFLTFDITAFGQDAYIPKTLTYMASSTGLDADAHVPTTAQGIGFFLQRSAHNLATSSVASLVDSTTADEETNTYLVREDDTESFTLKVTITNASALPLDALQARAILTGINVAASDTATGASVYTSDLEDTFRTPYGRIAD